MQTFAPCLARVSRCAMITLAASLLSLTAGCAVTPSVRDVDEVSINILADSDFYLDLQNEADPDTRPGKLAGEGAAEGLKDCSDPDHPVFSVFMAPLCALVGATAGAVTGAAVTAATTVNEEKGDALKQQSNTVTAREFWRDMLLSKLESAGRDRGKRIVPYPEGKPVHVFLEDLPWKILPGDTISISGRFTVAVRAGDDFARTSFNVSSAGHDIDRWIEGGTALIEQELESFWQQASERIWQAIDG